MVEFNFAGHCRWWVDVSHLRFITPGQKCTIFWLLLYNMWCGFFSPFVHVVFHHITTTIYTIKHFYNHASAGSGRLEETLRTRPAKDLSLSRYTNAKYLKFIATIEAVCLRYLFFIFGNFHLKYEYNIYCAIYSWPCSPIFIIFIMPKSGLEAKKYEFLVDVMGFIAKCF